MFDVTASGYHGQQEHEFSRLVDGLQRGQYSIVICWAIDRLTRQGVSETLQAVNRITRAGGTLVSLQESWIETSGELRDLLVAIVGWVANFESRRRSERIKSGLARRRAVGLPVGRLTGAKDLKPPQGLRVLPPARPMNKLGRLPQGGSSRQLVPNQRVN